MDALSDVLRVIRLTGGIFLNAEFSDPWCVASRLEPALCGPLLDGAEALILFHYVYEGRMRVQLDGGQPVEVTAGHAVLLPSNDTHRLGSALARAPVPASEIMIPPEDGGIIRIVHGGGGEVTRIVCGFLGCRAEIAAPLSSALPPLLLLNVLEGSAGRWMHDTLRFAADHNVSNEPGLQTVLAKLSEVLFIDAVRRYIDTLPEGATGWLAGLRDPLVGKALALLHGDVSRNWTVEELGRGVGASRSVLAERFTRLVGEPPMQYLSSWRMRMAADSLRLGRKPLIEIAGEVGYDSEAAFIRAFRREYGSPPAAWRRRFLAQDAETA